MLDKLLSKFKPVAKNTDEQDDSEEHSEKSSRKGHDSSDKEPASGDDPNKKRISTIIRVVVVLGLAYLAFDMFLKGDNQNAQVETVAEPVRKPRKKKKVDQPPAETSVAQTDAGAAMEATNAPAPDSQTPPEAALQPPVENINISPPPQAGSEVPVIPTMESNSTALNNAPELDPKPQEDKPLEVKAQEELRVESAPIPNTVSQPDLAVAPEAPVATPNLSTDVASTENKTQDTVGMDKSIDAMIDKIDGAEKKEGGEGKKEDKKVTKLEDKIVEEAVYVPPPSYEQTGRGLVYNCKEGFWACIDKDSYINCNKNMKYNKANGKTIECSVFNVYINEEDCVTVQKHNVSTSVPTTFCK